MTTELFCGPSDKDRATKYISQVAAMEQATFSDPWTEDMLRDTLNYDHNILFLTTEDDTVIAYLIANLLMDQSELLRVAVAPTHRNNRIGSSIVTTYLSEIRDLCDTSILEVRATNTPARHLYETMGYTAITTRKAYYKAPVEDAVIYSLDL